ncbi:MAG TPA: hypothetical protein DCM08_01270 [Microscillaceae bacterium]|jgi:hypothetical protein|nr:hypothetical protein [Microscillaceae bacterium]
MQFNIDKMMPQWIALMKEDQAILMRFVNMVQMIENGFESLKVKNNQLREKVAAEINHNETLAKIVAIYEETIDKVSMLQQQVVDSCGGLDSEKVLGNPFDFDPSFDSQHTMQTLQTYLSSQNNAINELLVQIGKPPIYVQSNEIEKFKQAEYTTYPLFFYYVVIGNKASQLTRMNDCLFNFL